MANQAVLVGINKYKMANSDLSGCVNDVTSVSLEIEGDGRGKMEATTKNILK